MQFKIKCHNSGDELILLITAEDQEHALIVAQDIAVQEWHGLPTTISYTQKVVEINKSEDYYD